jgi:uncharacterized protein YndB with AHSA1/START domain
MSTGTVELHRVLRAPPGRVYRAFLDAAALARWLPPFGYTGTVHQLDAVVGGRWRMSFTHFDSGQSHSFGGEYLALQPGVLLRYTSVFDDPNLPGQMETCVTLRQVLGGTDFRATQSGIPGVIPLEMCHLGWQESLVQLAQLVEPEIPV